MSIWKNDRRQRIFRLVSEFKSVTTEHLIRDLSVSRETVRRDLLDMEAQGYLRRVHGGAVARDAPEEPPLDVRTKLHAKEKMAIAKAACGLILDHKVIYFDAGSTTIHLGQQLASIHGLHVITNSLEAAASLQKSYSDNQSSSSLTLLGGSMAPFGFSTSGAKTISEISRVKADIAFVSPAAIDPEYGAMSAVQQEADIAAAMLENSEENAILADSSKFSARANYRYCAFHRMGALVTDANVRAVPGFPDERVNSVTQLVLAG